jgi:hypothetical protein
MRKNLLQRSAWSALVLVLLVTISHNTLAGSSSAPAMNCKRPYNDSTAALRLKGAVDSLLELFDSRRTCRIPDRGQWVSGSEGIDLSPLD